MRSGTQGTASEFDLILRGGTVVTAETTECADVAVKAGRIAAVVSPNLLPKARQEINITGRLLMPGGVDPHTHIQWTYITATRVFTGLDDPASATTAAAFGGTTTVIDSLVQKDASAEESIAKRREQFDGKVVLDYALVCAMTDPSEENINSIKRIVESGIPTFKVYLIYRKRGIMVDDWMLYRMLEKAREHGALLHIHAENGPIGEGRMAQFLSQGRKTPWDFRQAKTNFIEAEAIQRAIFLAEEIGAPLYIRHISTAEGLEMLRAARSRNAWIFGETCPHYFTLDDGVYRRPDAHRFMCSPPIKGIRDRDALFGALLDGLLHTVGADHSGWGVDMKDEGRSSFDEVLNGLPGIETRGPVTYTRCVVEGGMSFNRFVALTSTNPAKLAGLYPRKGTIAVGSDADLIVIDPDKERVVDPETLYLRQLGWNPFAGMTLRGFPDVVLSRGEVIIEDGRCLAQPGRGKYLHAQPGGYLAA